METRLLLFGAALLAGAMNAIAGGGSFVTVPTLVFTGVPPVVANATSTVALFPGSLSSAWAYRKELGEGQDVKLRTLALVSLMGGLCGALLLLLLPEKSFARALPWLLLLGTVAFAFGRQLGELLKRRIALGKRALIVTQLVLGVYGGYFGGALGIMMMAAWTVIASGRPIADDVSRLNANKTLLTGITNSIAVVCFVIARRVFWAEALTMLVAAVIGGYGGARLGRLLPNRAARIVINCINVTMTTVFFVRYFR